MNRRELQSRITLAGAIPGRLSLYSVGRHRVADPTRGRFPLLLNLPGNRTTVLTSPITLGSSNSNHVAGDWFDVVLVATASGGTIGQGPLIDFVAGEDAG